MASESPYDADGAASAEAIDALRKRARDVLVQASSDGRLHTALQSVSWEPRHWAQDRGLDSIDVTRRQVREMLTQAALSGQLRTLVSQLLDGPSHDGQVSQPSHGVTARGVPADAAVRSAEADEARAPPLPAAVESEYIRIQMRNALTRASADGTLQQAIGAVGGSESFGRQGMRRVHPREEDRHASAASSPTSRARSGSISASVAPPTAPFANHHRRRPQSHSRASEALRDRVRATLAQASIDGRLATALRGASIASSGLSRGVIADLRSRTRRLLLQASLDGRFAPEVVHAAAVQGWSESGEASGAGDGEEAVESFARSLGAQQARRSGRDATPLALAAAQVRESLLRAVADGQLEQVLESLEAPRARAAAGLDDDGLDDGLTSDAIEEEVDQIVEEGRERSRRQCLHGRAAAEVCSICLESSDPESEICIFQCSHVFHAACIEAWLRRRRVCPNCRYNLEMRRADLQR
mmetsp:Transcript_20195/g.36598  ORF Transcript_20195/g.36598 Transcript_20195/m.36598 type:complete len:471 (+) Transcript_20195:67-1479(+)